MITGMEVVTGWAAGVTGAAEVIGAAGSAAVEYQGSDVADLAAVGWVAVIWETMGWAAVDWAAAD